MMDRWEWIALVLGGLYVVWGLYHNYRVMPKRQAKQMAEAEERRTSDEYVIQRQREF
jgi:hypothetical protein